MKKRFPAFTELLKLYDPWIWTKLQDEKCLHNWLNISNFLHIWLNSSNT
jgi:hypothetical protein